MGKTEKTETLRDGRKVTIRDMRSDDLARSLRFFTNLPEEDRRYLRTDVRRWQVIKRRIEDIGSGRVLRLVAVTGDEIVADGTLELEGHGWGDGVAEIRLIVARDYQRLGLGSLLARELHFLAAKRDVSRVIARMMQPQVGARGILLALGFHDEFVIPRHVRDQDGNWQDLVIMRRDMEDLRAEMEEKLVEVFERRWRDRIG